MVVVLTCTAFPMNQVVAARILLAEVWVQVLEIELGLCLVAEKI